MSRKGMIFQLFTFIFQEYQKHRHMSCFYRLFMGPNEVFADLLKEFTGCAALRSVVIFKFGQTRTCEAPVTSEELMFFHPPKFNHSCLFQDILQIIKYKEYLR